MADADQPWALVVDDNVTVRADAVAILEDAGFGVLDACGVEEALDLLSLHHPRLSLLFTDVQMPGRFDGFHLAREASRRWPQISIVVASGDAKPGPTDMPGKATFIDKPFSAQIVHDHLRRYLPERQKPDSLKT